MPKLQKYLDAINKNKKAAAGTAIGAGVLATPEDAEASMIGQLAKNFNKDALKMAEDLEKAGAPMEAIRKQTGYVYGTPTHKGLDGKWRQEIDDSKAYLRTDFDTLTPNKPEVFTLSNTINHPEYMANYPELAKLKTSLENAPPNMYYFGDDTKGYKGSDIIDNYYSGVDKKIQIKNSQKSDAESYALHEMAHPIQELEGFAKGGNSQFAKLGLDIDKTRKDIAALEKTGVDAHWEVKRLDDMREMLAKNKAAMKNNPNDEYYANQVAEYEKRIVKGENEIAARLAQLKSDLPQLERLEKNGVLDKSNFEIYQRYLGEAEARQTQARRKMSMKERIETQPTFDVPESELIIRGQKGAATPKAITTLGGLSLAGSAVAKGLGTLPQDVINYADDIFTYSPVGVIPEGINSYGKLIAMGLGKEKKYQQNIGQYFDKEAEAKTVPYKAIDDAVGGAISQGIMTYDRAVNFLKNNKGLNEVLGNMNPSPYK